MNLADAFRIALGGLVAHRLRSALTTLGIIIGVGAVVSLMSIGEGAQAQVTAQIQGLGTNLLIVMPGAAPEEGRMQGPMGSAATLTLEDAQALEDPGEAPLVTGVAPQAMRLAQVVAEGSNMRAQVLGVTPEFMEMLNFSLAAGDFISQSQVQARASVAVLGSNAAQTLFGDSDPLDKRVRIAQRPFRVIGVLQSRGSGGMFGSQDDMILIPISTHQTRLGFQRTAQGAQNVQLIYLQVQDGSDTEAAKVQVANILRQLHRVTDEDDFTITSQEDLISAIRQVTAVFTLFLGAVAGISLLVGGIGIMNIMLVSVTERTREIGIRKAVGARRRDILLQFLLEATFLSLGGGGAGLAVGWAVSRAFARVNLGGQFLSPLISPTIVLLAFGVSAAIGLFFGIYPASRAARLDPIEALHYE